jgi:hypothetical protein
LLTAPGLEDPRSQIIEVGATLADVTKVLEEWLAARQPSTSI